MNIPNILTVIRFFLVPVFIFFFYGDFNNNILLATNVFIMAGITDVLDGHIARKYNLITKWGQAMDPLADKLMQITVLACFADRGFIPLWVLLFIGLKEMFMIVGGCILYYHKDRTVIPANGHGKVATVLFYIAILSIAFKSPYSTSFVILTVIFTLIAFLQYIIGFKRAHEKIF